MPISDFIPTGKDNAISCRALAARAGLSERDVQEAVLHARADGNPICSGSRGYFMPRDAAEALSYLCAQVNRIRSGTLALRSVRDFVRREGAREDFERLEQIERGML